MTQIQNNPESVTSASQGQSQMISDTSQSSVENSPINQQTEETKKMTESPIDNPIIIHETVEVSNPEKLNSFLASSGIEPYDKLPWEYLKTETNQNAWDEVARYLGFKLDDFYNSDVVKIPYIGTDGKPIKRMSGSADYCRYRFIEETEGKGKYMSPMLEANHIYFSPHISPNKWKEVKQNKDILLIIVEGEKKAEYLNQVLLRETDLEAVAVGISGVWNWKQPSNQTINLTRGERLFNEQLADGRNEGIKQLLEELPLEKKQKLCKALEVWSDWLIIAQYDKTLNKIQAGTQAIAKPLHKHLDDFIVFETSNRESPTFTAAFKWNLEDELNNRKSSMPSSKYEKMLKALENAAEGVDVSVGEELHPELKHFKLRGRQVLINFDSDIFNTPRGSDGHYNEGVAGAARRLALALHHEGALPKMMLIPPPVKFHSDDLKQYSDESSKFGIDDYGMTYGDKSVVALMKFSRGQDALVENKNVELKYRSFVSTYVLNLTVNPVLSGCWTANFLKNRLNLAYKSNDALYQWNGQYWNKVNDEFPQRIVEEYLQLTVGKKTHVSTVEILKTVMVSDSHWNNKANSRVLYANGSYDLSLCEFYFGFNKEDYFTTEPIKADYKEFDELEITALPTLVNYLMSYSEGDALYLQYIIAAIRWTVCPKGVYEKLPVEKFFSLVGKVGSGKSTMLEMLMTAIGKSNCYTFTLKKLDSPEGLHAYEHKKMLVNMDASGTLSRESSENINKLVSGETLETRALFKQSRQVRMQPVLWMAGNEILNFGITGTQGLSRRLITVPIERAKNIHVDSSLTRKLTSKHIQSALFWLYRQLTEQDMIDILNHTRYLPEPIAKRTVEHGKEQNPLRNFWEYLDNKFTDKEKAQGFTKANLMTAYKTWSDLNNEYGYKVEKIMSHLKDIEAVAPKLNAEGNQYAYRGERYFIINPYKDHTTDDLRVTENVDNGRPLIILNPDKFTKTEDWFKFIQNFKNKLRDNYEDLEFMVEPTCFAKIKIQLS